ncbi:MAG: hypothetical protein ACE5M4_09120 [Anaerolineales bacterium]
MSKLDLNRLELFCHTRLPKDWAASKETTLALVARCRKAESELMALRGELAIAYDVLDELKTEDLEKIPSHKLMKQMREMDEADKRAVATLKVDMMGGRIAELEAALREAVEAFNTVEYPGWKPLEERVRKLLGESDE